MAQGTTGFAPRLLAAGHLGTTAYAHVGYMSAFGSDGKLLPKYRQPPAPPARHGDRHGATEQAKPSAQPKAPAPARPRPAPKTAATQSVPTPPTLTKHAAATAGYPPALGSGLVAVGLCLGVWGWSWRQRARGVWVTLILAAALTLGVGAVLAGPR